MKKFLSVILTITLLLGCMFISVGAENELIISSEYYCGFEDYQTLLTGNTATDTFDNMSFSSSVAQIVEENAFAGEKAMKLTLAANGLTAFELRNKAPFELNAEEYIVTFAYKTNSNIEISLGMAKANSVPATAKAATTLSVSSGDNWQTGTLSFVADKSYADGYVPAVIVFAKVGAEVYFDDITVTSKSGLSYLNMPEIEFSSAWYPTFKPANQINSENEIQVWDGTVAESFAGGSGTEADPYLISNGAELALAITKSGTVQVTDPETAEVTMQREEYYGSYYKITADIYLNSPDAADWKNISGAQKGLNSWYNYYNYNSKITGESFAGILDGGNHTVYGMYYYDTAKESNINYRNHNIGTGLIPRTDENFNVVISNLGVDCAFLRHQYTAGAVVGTCGSKVTINNCYVGENVGICSVSEGAMIGTANQKKATINNCYSLATFYLPNASHLRYGMVGFATQSKPLSISNSYIVGAPLTSTTTSNANTKYEFRNTYSTVVNGTSTGTTSVLENVFVIADSSKMQGLDALTNTDKMPFLDSAVYTATNGYPVLSSFIKKVDEETGEEIEIWDGTVATAFAKGSGTEDDPFIISNGAELALAVSSGGGNDVYYEITKDIYLNDLSKINWRSGAVLKAYEADGLNTWYGSKTVFAGNVEGNGHTVYGLYRYEANALKEYVTNYNYGGGLFSKVTAGNTLNVSNLTVDYCYIHAECNAAVFVGYAENGANLNFTNVGIGENIALAGGRVGLFHAYAMSGNTVNVNINNCYSLADTNAGFIGIPSRTNAVIKGSYAAKSTMILGDAKSSVSLENCYQAEAGSYTEGITTLIASNMKGTDVLTNENKMPLLNSAVFEAKDRTFEETDYVVFLPKGSIIENAEIAAVYDNMCAPIDKSSAIVDNLTAKDCYVKFAAIPKAGDILVPAQYASFVRQGSRYDMIKADYYYDALSDRVSRNIDKFGDKTVNYIFVTDLHYEGNDKQDSSIQEREAMLKEVQFIVDWANSDASIDFVVLGGDLIDGNNTREKSLGYLNELLTPFRSCTKPVLAVVGNHDDNTYSGTFSMARVISDKDWNDNVIDYIVNKDGDVAVQDSTDPNSKHYYYDLESKKTRVICLDSCDYYNEYDETGAVTYLDIRDASLAENKHDRYYTCANYRGYSVAQLNWLVNEALTADEGWDYVFISHQGIDDNTNSKYSVRYGEVLRGIIAAFQNGTTYINEEMGITADYTDNTAKILSFQFGHTHTELTLYEEDVKLWQINTESANYDEVGATRAPGRPTAWNPNLNWISNLHEAGSESEANFDVMSVCQDFVYKQNVGVGVTEKLYYPDAVSEGDMNEDGVVDILDLVEQNLVLIGEKNVNTTADVNNDNILEVALDSAALRYVIVK